MEWKGRRVKRPSLAELAREHAYGRTWYLESGQSVDAYATSRGLDPQRVADVVAILSPRVSVSQNVKLARRYLETGSCPGAMRQRVAALAAYEHTGAFKGPKVNAFASALAGDGDAVVIDAWMARLFGSSGALTPKQYRGIVARVRGVSTRLGWHPSETQAALWCGARALCGFTDSYSPLRMGAL